MDGFENISLDKSLAISRSELQLNSVFLNDANELVLMAKLSAQKFYDKQNTNEERLKWLEISINVNTFLSSKYLSYDDIFRYQYAKLLLITKAILEFGDKYNQLIDSVIVISFFENHISKNKLKPSQDFSEWRELAIWEIKLIRDMKLLIVLIQDLKEKVNIPEYYNRWFALLPDLP